MTTLQKVVKYLALAFAIFLSASIISGICGAIFSVSLFFGDNEPDEVTSEYAVTNNITGLMVDISAAELEIKTGDKFCVETNHKHLTCKENKDVLEIKERKPFFSVTPGGIKVILTIPKDTAFDYVDINTGAGRVTVDELSSTYLDMDLGAGEFVAKRLFASDRAEIDGGAGSVTIMDGYLNSAELEMGIGELNLTSELDGKSSIDYGVGEVRLVLLGSREDYQIELDKGVGEARLEGKQMSDDSVYGSGSKRLEIDGGIGELNITFEDSLSEKQQPDSSEI